MYQQEAKKWMRNEKGNGTLLGIIMVAVLSLMSLTMFTLQHNGYSGYTRTSQEARLRLLAEWAVEYELLRMREDSAIPASIYKTSGERLLLRGADKDAQYYVYGRYNNGKIELWVVAECDNYMAQAQYYFDYDEGTGEMQLKGMM